MMMKNKKDKITEEDKEIMGYCQTCSHEWFEHLDNGCTRDYCSCPYWQTEEESEKGND